MSEYIKVKIKKKKVTIIDTGDWHVGSLAFHEQAAKDLVQQILDKGWYVRFNGDAVEAKLIDSPHFNPDGLKPRQLNAHAQADAFIKLFKPLCDYDRCLLYMPGNHDQYLSPNFDLCRYIAKEMGIEDRLGSYQSWSNVNGVTSHHWHGRPTMPRGAKDPVQREANQMAWLKNRLEGLAGSAQAQYMAHTHVCLVVKPREHYTLLDSGDNCKARFFHQKPVEIDGELFVPPDARWYANTGTLRRSGQFGYQDYSEVAGYPPLPMSCVKTKIADGRILKVEKVIL